MKKLSGTAAYRFHIRFFAIFMPELHFRAKIPVKQWGRLAVQPKTFDCDYYDGREGRREGLSYHGEYLAQSGWSEDTNALPAGAE